MEEVQAMAAQREVCVAVVGVGLVGSEFLSQLAGVKRLRLVALSSSRKYIFNQDGITFSSAGWAHDLAASRVAASLDFMLPQLAALVHIGRKVVLVDNTASADVAAFYPRLAAAGINIVTPNKKAFAGPLRAVDTLTQAATAGGVRVLNEATVGAGLPILSTLRDLVATGDKIVRIEGVMSGTLSYIFNEYSPPGGGGSNVGFSSIVRTAREKGYTEPHPGDDLSGADVARKLAILSRMVPQLARALPQGYESVNTTSLVPAELQTVESGDEFVAKLPEHDAHFATLRDKARASRAVLRYVGVIDVAHKRVSASLEQYPETHAFATSLGGSDNIFAFYTERYQRPLLIQGAGAGAAVTAMGALSDILKLLL